MTPFPRSSSALAVVLALAGFAAAARASLFEPEIDSTSAVALAREALPRFARFGWVSPPLEWTSPARYAELAGAGFNLTVPAWDDTGWVSDNLARLDATRPLGVRNLILDNQLDHVSVTDAASLALLDSIVARYRDDPAFLGYYLGDEPPPDSFRRLGDWFRLLRARDPAHPAWNNLLPLGAFMSPAAFATYLRQYVSATRPAVLCNSTYDFCYYGDNHRLTQNIATLSSVARENHLPFWGVIQLIEHGPFRHVTEGMLRWQAAQWLAWGARGIGYFTYWTPAPDLYWNWRPAMIEWGTGKRTEYYDVVKRLNAHLSPIGNVLAGCQWVATQHAGSVPPGGVLFAPDSVLVAVEGRATVGRFVDSTGTPCVLVANADSLLMQTVTLVLARGREASRLGVDGLAWDGILVGPGGRLPLALGPGDFVLLRMAVGVFEFSVGAGEGAGRGAAPQLWVHPNPARGPVRMGASGQGGASRLAVLDLAGRPVWSRVLPAGAFDLAWNGERDDGGRVRPGIYFARLQSALGVSVRRLAWLGAP